MAVSQRETDRLRRIADGLRRWIERHDTAGGLPYDDRDWLSETVRDGLYRIAARLDSDRKYEQARRRR